jgi:hypothetical protein
MAKPTYTVDKKLLMQFLVNVRQEILNIQFGEPRWRTGAPIHFETDKEVPVNRVLERLEQSPSKVNFDAFIAQATQDLGKPTGEGFATWGQPLFTKVKADGKPEVAKKTFADSIKDGFYDCFKVAHISLDQKQVDRMAVAANRMAQSFQAEISRSVGNQLEVLVARMKESEKVKKNDD